ncbi:MAG TPA: galactose mutarotase, partial [Chitinophagaceae bacterium]|nr:galactose mutarotase [Chitinophagaceae bacterium]
TLEYSSPDGEEGYPGNLVTLFNITLTPKDELILTTTATTDKPTAVNLTHHDYFCLDNSGHIGNHQVQIHSSAYLEQDDNFVTTGNKIPVAGTPHDFTQLRKVNANWVAADGFDQTFVLDNNNQGGLQPAATCISNETGLKLEVLTTEPVVHFYTGKWNPVLEYKSRKVYGPFSGLCFETHKEPNAINIPSFSNTVLRPGEVYSSTTVYRVS